MSQCISIRFAFTFYFCHRWWRPRFPTERRWSCSGRRRKRRRRSSGRRTASRSTVATFVPSFSQFKICFFYEKSPLPPLWLLLGSPMLMDPHHSQQYAGLQHAVWLLHEVGNQTFKASFKPTLSDNYGMDGGTIRCQYILVRLVLTFGLSVFWCCHWRMTLGRVEVLGFVRSLLQLKRRKIWLNLFSIICKNVSFL